MFRSQRSFIKILLQQDLVKVFSLNALATVIKMVTGFVGIKIIASMLGPKGIALIGQLSNFVSIVLVIASAGINQGVTKYVAENKDSESLYRKFIGSAFKITVISSVLSGIGLITLRSYLSAKILNSDNFKYLFIIFGISIIFFALNNLMLSIINGFQKYGDFIRISILNSIIGLFFTLLLVYLWGLDGALVSLITYQSVIFIITFKILKRENWWNSLSIYQNIDREIIIKYLNYSIMAVTTAATIPVSQLFIRSYIISNMSLDAAGLWEGMNKLSSIYLMVITSSLSIYYLPKLAELNSVDELRKETKKVFKFIVPGLILGLFLIYLFRLILIRILFSSGFEPMSDLFIYQLIGDFFKIISWILAFNMVAKSMTLLFVITEIITSISFVLLSLKFVEINGIKGITQAYMLNYLMYFIAMIILFRKLIFKTKTISSLET